MRGFAVIVMILIAAPARSQQHLDAYKAAALYRDAIVHATDLYETAGLAPACGLRDWPWMFDVQARIQQGEQKNIANYSAFTDDKARFEGLARALFQEQVDRMRAFDDARDQLASASACLDLRSSGALDRLDALIQGLHKP
jgi:hypothetical protein